MTTTAPPATDTPKVEMTEDRIKNYVKDVQARSGQLDGPLVEDALMLTRYMTLDELARILSKAANEQDELVSVLAKRVKDNAPNLPLGGHDILRCLISSDL